MVEARTFQVVIPTMKGRDFYLTDAILSVLEQQYPEVEVIVSNNGADSAIRNCVKSFNSPLVKYVETEIFTDLACNCCRWSGLGLSK